MQWVFLAVEREKFGAIGGKRCDRNKPGGWMILDTLEGVAGCWCLNLSSGFFLWRALAGWREREGKDLEKPCRVIAPPPSSGTTGRGKKNNHNNNHDNNNKNKY